jgi:hypothetical protein
MAHYYYCPFANCHDPKIAITEYRYAVKYGDPQYAHVDPRIYRSKEAGRTDSVVLKTNVRWETVIVENVSRRRPAYISSERTPPLSQMRSDDTLIIDGHGARGSESLYSSESCASESISAKELALHLAMDGLQRDHVYIKLAVCHSGGAFDGDEQKVLARALAIALGFIRWNPESRTHDTTMKTGAYRRIKVGGFQGKLNVRGQNMVNASGIIRGYQPLPNEVQGSSTVPAKHKLVYFDADGNLYQKTPLNTQNIQQTITTTVVHVPMNSTPPPHRATVATQPTTPSPTPKPQGTGQVAALRSRFENS